MSDRDQVASISIDSRDKSSGTTTNFSIDLDSNGVATLNKVKRIEFTHIEIPYTFYSVTSSNNEVNFLNTADEAKTATIPAGNYTGATLATALQTAMNAEMSGFTIAYDANTQKLAATNAAQFTMSGTGDGAAIVGFTAAIAKGTSATATNPVQVQGPQYLMLKSVALSRMRGRTRKYFNGTGFDDTVYRIPVNVAAGSVIHSYNRGDKYILTPKALQLPSSLDFELEDDRGNTLDLNNQHWSLEMLITCGTD